MNQLHHFSLKISAFANRRNTIVTIVLFLLCQILLGKIGSQISQPLRILDCAFAYSPDTAYNDYISKYSDAAREAYKIAVGIDMFYPLIYATLLAFLLSFVLKNTRFYTLNLLPFFASFFDYFENTGIFIMLVTYPEKCYFWAIVASIFGATKWICVATSIVLYFTFLFKKMTRLLLCLCLGLFANYGFAQNTAQEDVVYLKNGGVLRGSILEQTPNASLKIQIVGNNIFVVKMEDVERIVKEKAAATSATATAATATAVTEQPETPFKSGLVSTVRVGALVSLAENGGIGATTNYALGYQFNRNLSLGIGGGLDYYTDYQTSVPVFLDFRITPTSGKIVPVFALAGGYSFGSFSGLMLNPSIGLKVKMSPKTNFLIDAGYKHQSGFIYLPVSWGSDAIGATFGSLALNIGLQF